MRLTRIGEVQYRDCGCRDDGSPDFVQWWYFDAEFDCGHRLMAILVPRAFGRIEGESNGPDPMVTLTITDPSGKDRRARTFYVDDFHYATDHPLVRYGSESFMECRDGRYRLCLQEEDVACDLLYEPQFPPWAPLPGRNGQLATPLLQLAQGAWTPGAYFHYASVIPRATVTGTLTVAGQTQAIRGQGYHEQGRSNLPFTKVFSFWYWTRAYLGDWTFIFPVAATTRRSHHLSLRSLLIYYRGERVCDLFDPTGVLLSHRVTRSWHDADAGREIPREVRFSAHTPSLQLEMTMELRHQRERFRFETFSDHTPLAPLWLQHLTHVQARLRWRGQRHDVEGEGVFETMLSGAI